MRDSRKTSATIAVALFAIAYAGFLIPRTAFSVGGSDSSGYANSARRLLAGTLVSRPRTLERLGLPDDRTQFFIPLGFVDGPRPGTMAPFYPVGFPAHFAAAARTFGWERAPFLVSPIAAILCVPLFYLLARELALPRSWSLAGTALFAAWPVLVGQAVQPMSDAVGTLWSMATIAAALRSRSRGPAWALAAGAAFALAVLVRPTNVLLAAPVALALPWTGRALLAFLAGGVPFGAALGVYNRHCFGNAFDSGYRRIGLTGALAISNFPLRFLYYSEWILRTLTPLVPAGWLVVAAVRSVRARTRLLLLSWFGVFFLFHCFYEPYDSFFFVRFLLPGSPALFLGALLSARFLLGRWSPRAIAIAAGFLFAAVLAAEISSMRRSGVLDVARFESIYPRICRLAQVATPREGVVLSMAASGALEYYTDVSYARWDWLDPAAFAALRARPETRGVRWFALLFPFEMEQLPAHAPGNWRKLASIGDVGFYELDPRR